MPLRLYNTMTRQKEEFSPLDPSDVRMYVCGPTVYDYAHIGNARPAIVFDVMFRLLRQLYGAEHVKYVRNITDVDDKINARARAENISIRELTEKTFQQYQADVTALGCLPPTVQPRATEHIAEMIAIIGMLIAKGHAYAADGHVLFNVPSMADYGKLSRRSLDEMVAGARVDVAPYKRGDMDFVLWKPSDAETPGWDSPWGRGRPGWHIECSAMSWKHLGEKFDIHGGGIDLIFPHHENEVAQNLCAFGHGVMANVWMHNGFLQVEGQKMSKSLGNFVTIRELLRGWRGEPWSGAAVRLEMLGTHYRQPIDWDPARLTLAKAHIQALAGQTSKRSFQTAGKFEEAWNTPVTPSAAVMTSLLDDLNTAESIGVFKAQVSKITTMNDAERVQLVHDARFLGLMDGPSRPYLTGSFGMSNMAEAIVNDASLKFRDWRVFKANGDEEASRSVEHWFDKQHVEIKSADQIKYNGTDPTRGKIESLVDARLAARKAKNWAESDRIRDELSAMGVAIKDNKDGTTAWEVRR